MPGRTRPAASNAIEVAALEEQHQPTMSGLQFNEKLSWPAGKPIAVAELLRRLQALATEMTIMDQDEEDDQRQTFKQVAKDLVNPRLLAHKDKGVRAWTACCLVDILRLCAPDAPFTEQQLRDLFTMIITIILPALSDPSDAYNNQHTYVLNSLSEVKSILLVADIPSSESLIHHLFTAFFDIVSGSSKSSTGEQLGKSVEYNMSLILVTLVDESTSLSTEVIDVIVAQFLRTDPRAIAATTPKNKKNGVIPAIDGNQSTLTLKDYPPAYNMAKTVCNSCPEKMARYISGYFSEVIVEASGNSGMDRSHRRHSDDLDENELPTGPSEEDLKELYKAHSLVRELWRSCPGVLQNVIPQLEAELSAENVQLRLLATETLGDIASGIGAVGPPSPPTMDAAAYPPLTLTGSVESASSFNILTTPSSPQPFPQAHAHAYSSFLGRRQDKSSIIRSAWTTGIGRILSTSAGGVGLGQHDEQRLIGDLARMLGDSDEKVRLAAVKAVGRFNFKDIIIKLGSSGSVDTPGSVLAQLGERVKDRKHSVRIEAMRVLARIWGVAIGEIAAGNELVVSVIGGAPSKILNAYYLNDQEINVLLDRVVFDLLLPLAYPPIKNKAVKPSNGASHKTKDSHALGDSEVEQDADKIRVERILLMAKYLDPKAKKIFFMISSRQATMGKYILAYLQCCEDYNGGVMDANEDAIKDRMSRLIEALSKQFPEQAVTTAELWKFAKMHDRRSYQLVRFCIAADSEYRTVIKAIREFTKRLESSTVAPAGILDTMIPILYRGSMLLYNKSHVPAIVEYSRSDEKSLGSTAHELLGEISTWTPEVLKVHITEICKNLVDEAPTAGKPNKIGAADDLKACSAFAHRFPKEIKPERKFIQAMTSYAMYGSPPEAAKHAVSIIMAASDKKEMHARDLAKRCVKDFRYGNEGFLSRLAAISQLWLLLPDVLDNDSDDVIEIAIQQILLKVRAPSTEPSDSYTWSDNVDEECTAKCWALKILVNRLRSHPDLSNITDIANPVFQVLSTLIAREGELAETGNTPSSHKSRLRLLAARSYLKLSTLKNHEVLIEPASFNQLAEVAQDPLFYVRTSFLHRLKKYLSKNQVPSRFYAIPFLLAFEPDTTFKFETATWIRSRAQFLSNLSTQASASSSTASGNGTGKASTILETSFARLLSLLAHHPDYTPTPEDLIDFARYILFYLSTIANEENLSLIYHIAQRVKGCRDAVGSPAIRATSSIGNASPNGSTAETATTSQDFTSNLHHLSDLAQLTIRRYEDSKGWNMQTLPTHLRLTLPRSLFTEIKDHSVAMKIAESNFLPEGVAEGVEALIRRAGRKERIAVSSHHGGRGGESGKKRRSDGADNERTKKLRGEGTKKSLSTKKAASAGRQVSTKSAKVSKAATKGWNSEDDDEADAETPRRKISAHPSSSVDRRRSGRVKDVSQGIYAERDDDEDDEEMEEVDEEGEAEEEMRAEGDSEGDADVEETGEEEEDPAPTSNAEEEEEEEEEEMNDKIILNSGPPGKTNGKAAPKPDAFESATDRPASSSPVSISRSGGRRGKQIQSKLPFKGKENGAPAKPVVKKGGPAPRKKLVEIAEGNAAATSVAPATRRRGTRGPKT